MDSHGLHLPPSRVCVVVQAAAGAPRALPGGMEDPRRGSRAPGAVRGACGRGCPWQRVGAQIWGTKLASHAVVAHIASLLGAPAPSRTPSVRVHGYLAQLGLAADPYAQLRCYAKEAFGSEVNVRVHRCTQVAHSTLNRPVFDPELEGVPEDWQGVRLGAPDTRLPDRLWQCTTRSSCRGHYQEGVCAPKAHEGAPG